MLLRNYGCHIAFIYMSHCTTTVVYISTQHYYTYKQNKINRIYHWLLCLSDFWHLAVGTKCLTYIFIYIKICLCVMSYDIMMSLAWEFWLELVANYGWVTSGSWDKMPYLYIKICLCMMSYDIMMSLAWEFWLELVANCLVLIPK